MTHKLFNVPPGTPFLHTLARAVLNGSLPETGGHSPSQLELSAYTILLPTRRAARALQEAFLAAAGGKAMLLPQIRPIAEGREDLSLIAALSGPAIFGPGAADVPPAVSEIERRLVLTSFVQHWSALMHKQAAMADVTSEQAIVLTAGAGTTAHASALAAELARLMDEIETEELSLAPLADIVPDQFSEHWSKTLEFLRIALESWPEYLKQHGLLSPMERRNRLIRAEAARLSARPPSTPVIVAGVTGSIPATAELMRVVAGLENGAVVLPGLDTGLDRESRDAIAPAHPEHPQFGLERLLAELRLATGSDTVTVLTGAEPAPDIAGRNRLISEAMRPAATSERWHVYAETADRQAVATALDGVTLIEAPTAEDEAETIALILREAVETPGQTAALVSRDRLLARRVAVRLESWGIRIDDSAGRPLAKTMPGAFLDLVIETIASGFWPATTMALLKHPLARLGLPAAQVRRAARALEIAIFRTLYIGRGIEGIIAALDRAEIDVKARERRGRAVQRLWDEDWAGARDLVDRLQSATAPLRTLFEMPSALELRDLARAHIATAEAAARLPEGDNARGLWAGEAGETASLFMTGLIEEGLPSLSVKADEYPDLYRSLVQGEIVRPKVLLHPRLSIWGPLEARLQQPDIVVIGGLNEGTWPEQV
ncbi:MAG: double-strand break repair protein AddB, partial [Hyphomicrobiaceae bacterium]